MLRQAENIVKVEGILSEVNLKYGTFSRDGKTHDTIGGNIVVKVTQKISGKQCELLVPVHMFATKFTKNGASNPAYESIKRVADEYTSIAAAGNEEQADRIRITRGSIRMNEYYSADGRLISFPRINASFISKIRKEDCKPEATFSVQFAVATKMEETSMQGEPTGRFIIKGILPQYAGAVDVVTFVAESEGVIDAVSTYWEIGDTVKANGRLNFSSTTETTYEEVDFGEPIEKIRTVNKSDLVITGGSQEALEGEFAFEKSELDAALAKRKAKLEENRERDMARAASKPTPTKSGFDDLGF